MDQNMRELLNVPTENPFLTYNLPEDLFFAPSLSHENENEEDLFALFFEAEMHDQQCSDKTPNNRKDALVTPLAEPVKETLSENDLLEKNDTILNEEDHLPEMPEENDPIMNGRMGNDVAIGVGSARLMEVGMSSTDANKAMESAGLAELALIDPQKAKKTWTKRQSAARSKKKRLARINDLRKRVNLLRAESIALTSKLEYLQKDADELIIDNTELGIRVCDMEHKVFLQDSLNEALKTKVQHLRIATGEVVAVQNNDIGFNVMQPYNGIDQNLNFSNNASPHTDPVPN